MIEMTESQRSKQELTLQGHFAHAKDFRLYCQFTGLQLESFSFVCLFVSPRNEMIYVLKGFLRLLSKLLRYGRKSGRRDTMLETIAQEQVKDDGDLD